MKTKSLLALVLAALLAAVALLTLPSAPALASGHGGHVAKAPRVQVHFEDGVEPGDDAVDMPSVRAKAQRMLALDVLTLQKQDEFGSWVVVATADTVCKGGHAAAKVNKGKGVPACRARVSVPAEDGFYKAVVTRADLTFESKTIEVAPR